MKKRIFTLLLACVLAAGTVAGPVGMDTVQAEFWSGDWECEEDDAGNIILIGYDGSEKNVEVPETISNQKVIGIGKYTFDDCKNLVSVTIPKSVTKIEAGILDECSKLEKIVVDGENSYYEADEAGILYSKGKTRLIRCPQVKKEVSIPGSVTEIGEWAFDGCGSLGSITIPDGVTSIGEYAFCECSSLASVTIPNSVTSIGGGAFRFCSSLGSVAIPGSVTSIGGSAFSYCSNLGSVTIPNSVTSIGDSAFQGCCTDERYHPLSWSHYWEL